MNTKTDRYRMRTRLIHGRMMSPRWSFTDHIVPPMSASTAYRLGNSARGAEGFREFANPEFNRHQESPIYIYDRLDEPSRGMLEEILAYAEGGECCVTYATGMAAIAASLGVLIKAGDTLISHKTIYGCTYSLLSNWFPRLGIKVVFADLSDLTGLAELLEGEPRATVVYGETPCNPSLTLLNLAGIAETVSHHNRSRSSARKVFTVIDNTFATPFCQRPIEHGIDVVVHSLTKNIGGFGTDMGGAVVGAKILEPDLLLYRKDFGGVLAPKGAWSTLVYGLPTLPLRNRRQIDTALRVARYLECHRSVEKVIYPGLESHPQHALAKHQMQDFEGNFAPGAIIYFVLNADHGDAKTRGAHLMDHLADNALSVTLAVALGQIRTLVEHPASMTHAPLSLEAQTAAGIDPGGIRLSIGLESSEDIIADLDSALQAA